ncbi:MAG: NADH:flavin oxidoreductase [Candidatus Bipolaricaulia bacterium]
MTTDTSTPSRLDTGVLFEPFELKRLSLRNRIVMAPMTRTSAGDYGVPTEAMAEYYARRARGGTGLVLTEGTYTDDAFSKGYFNEPGIVTEAQITGWQNVVERVHDEGAQIALQLFHAGRLSDPDVLGTTPRAPSAIPSEGQHQQTGTPMATPQAMTRAEIDQATEGFAQAASNAREAGFDAVEIHGAHGYLLDQFLWEEANQRTDAYGGSLANRLRLPTEVTRAVRQAVGDDFAVLYRFSMWKLDDFEHVFPGGIDELREIVTTLRDAGVDMFHVSTYDALAPALGTDRTLASLTRGIAGLPVIAVGKLQDPDRAAGLIRADDADLIALGKGQIANPDWALQIQHGRAAELQDFDPAMLATLL